MKRQLGSMLAVLVLCCAPLAWSQSDSSDGGSSSSSASSGSSSSSSSSASSGSTSGGATSGADAADDSTPAGGVSIGTSSGGNTNGSGIYSGSSSNDPYFAVASGQDGSTPSQDAPDTSDDTQSPTGPQSTFNHPELLPPITAITDATRNTGLAFSVGTGSLSNYVWGTNGQSSYWQNIGMWNGGISFTQLRARSIINLGYIGGVNLSSISIGSYNNYTTLNQLGNALILWNFANHWQMRVKDRYLYSDNPFEPFLSYTSDPTPNQPNPTVYFPQAVVEQNVGSIDVSYRMTAQDSVTVTGSESRQNYIRGTTGLYDNYSWGGGAFYQHVFNERLSAGFGYNFTAIDFSHGTSRAGVRMFEGFVAYKFNPGLSVSAWIGPEYTTTKDMIPIFCTAYGCFIEEKHDSQWNVAEGGTLSFAKNGNAVRVQTSHRVTDGGGVLGAVNLYQATLAYSRPISRVWSFATALMYVNSVSVSPFRAEQYWDSVQGTVSFNRKFGDSWNGAMYLLFINQSQNFFGTPGTSNTAGLGLTLRYVWGHTLGW